MRLSLVSAPPPHTPTPTYDARLGLSLVGTRRRRRARLDLLLVCPRHRPRARLRPPLVCPPPPPQPPTPNPRTSTSPPPPAAGLPLPPSARLPHWRGGEGGTGGGGGKRWLLLAPSALLLCGAGGAQASVWWASPGGLGLSVPLGRLCRAEGVGRCVRWLADGWPTLGLRLRLRWARSPPEARGLANPRAGPPHPTAPRVTPNPAPSVCPLAPAARSRLGHPPGTRAACLHHWPSASFAARVDARWSPLPVCAGLLP